jgi:hypothetical protein
MILLNGLSSLLAEGWGDFVTFIVIVAFYLVGALAKAWANRAKSEEKQKESKLRQMVEEAKGSILQEQTKGEYASPENLPYAKVVSQKQGDRHKRLSEWDRRQALKRTHRQEPLIKPVFHQKPPARTIPKGHVISVLGQGSPRPVQSAKPSVFQPVPVQQPPVIAVVPAAKKPVLQHPQSSVKTESIRQQIANKAKTSRAVYFANLLRSSESLRKAIILKEILDAPLAIREHK